MMHMSPEAHTQRDRVLRMLACTLCQQALMGQDFPTPIMGVVVELESYVCSDRPTVELIPHLTEARSQIRDMLGHVYCGVSHTFEDQSWFGTKTDHDLWCHRSMDEYMRIIQILRALNQATDPNTIPETSDIHHTLCR